MKLSICIATYNRPNGLKRLLESLNRIELPNNIVGFITICDNDFHRSAFPIVESVKKVIKFSVYYIVVEKRGIPIVRNALIKKSNELNADFVCFLDDDEYVPKDWLEKIFNKLESEKADVVFGPVIPVYEGKNNQKISQHILSDYKNFKDNQFIKYGSTNNVIMRMSSINPFNIRFDERFIYQGGTDNLYFHRMNKFKLKKIWCSDAFVFESVPESRQSMKWLIKRSFRSGISISRTDFMQGSISEKIVRLIKAIYNILVGSFKFILLSFTMQRYINSLCIISRGVGMLTIFTGIQYNEYKTIHGN